MVELAATRLAGREGRGDLLVVGPSLGTSVETLWGPCSDLLGDEFEVVGWDLPGHGRSYPTSSVRQIAGLASAVRELVGEADRRVWYAGISVGGAVGLHLASDPGPFRAVVALAAAPKIGNPASWRQRANLVRASGTGVMVAGSAARWFAPGFTDRRPDVATALLTELAGVDDESYVAICEALAKFDVNGIDVKVPLLLAVGEHDQVVPLAQVAGSGLPLAVLAGCGHLPAAEDPHAVAGLLRTYFQAQRGGR